ncbi:transcription factor SKN7-like isoform X2 [Magnolia sinica]|uniref:transcription factor SKN7-like isoform X2 n=1 Tax=Magnolia sinica TaxID=86752 RepID=UPI00265853AD|nr:transcription factor SKN7-like isoform X2 [Magnolia sinica]
MKEDGKSFLRSELLVVSLLSSFRGEVVSSFVWVVLVLVGWFWGRAVLERVWGKMASVWRKGSDWKIGAEHLMTFFSHSRGGLLSGTVGPTIQADLTDIRREASCFLPIQEFMSILPSVDKLFYGIPLPEKNPDLMATTSLNRGFWLSRLLSTVPQEDSGEVVMDSGGRDFVLSAGGGGPSSAGKILLVEDTEINRILLRKLFQDLNLLLEEAENGQIAVDYFKQGKNYDLVLMDKEMPVMDGHEATRQLRLLGVKTPIVALTGNSLQSDKDMFFQAGADEFQTKPLSRAELVRLLARYGLECPR